MIPEPGSKWQSYRGTRWVYVGPANPRNGVALYTLRCVEPTKNGRTTHRTGATIDVEESWFRMAAVVDPTPVKGRDA
jgi:hypothetical protein